MDGRIKLLVVEDDVDFRKALVKALSQSGYSCDSVGTLRECMEKIHKHAYDIILLDLKLPDLSGVDALKMVKENTEAKVIVITGYGDIKTAVEAMRSGASDFIQKPFNLDILEISIKRAVKEKITEEENLALKGILKKDVAYTFDTKNEKFKQLLSLCKKYAKTDANILIVGETGTGKEVIARYIHGLSDRRDKPFLVVECTSIPSEIFESELFGHEKGAFTGATTKKEGLVEMARGGTLFLDEVGDIPYHLQSKLLRFIETKSFRRVGGLREITTDVRIISATNKDLKELIDKGLFRDDLFYRLSTLVVEVPPLRERKEDIPILANCFCSRWRKKIGEKAIKHLMEYDWKGNIRELKNTIERACILADGEYIDNYLLINPESKKSCEELFEELPDLRTLEAKYIAMLIERFGDLDKVSKILGCSKRTLYRKLKRLKEVLQ
ncbi:MAG: sigma-54 dependent transcriptional regulator [Aquificota bacterium]|nr:MAG: sigma-54 dependent transcriptional regulator [Aquificota bacterium]